MNILKQYEQDGMMVTECTKDNETISHIVREAISVEVFGEPVIGSISSQQLAESQFQTMVGEINTFELWSKMINDRVYGKEEAVQRVTAISPLLKSDEFSALIKLIQSTYTD